MRHALLAVLLMVSLSARAQSAVSPADGAAIARVITAQIEAFRRDDGDAAFAFATPGIQQQFGNSAHFMDAVKQGYPQVYRPRSFKFLDRASEDGKVMQRVEIVGPDGGLVTAIYDMSHQPDGSWRIDGCRLEKTPLQDT